MPVQLIIKSAAQCVDDFALTCEMTWTIAEVKNQISILYPNKPKREQQKLIYGGKLLPDDLTLKSILNQVQDVYVMHLVCPLPPAPETEKNNTNKGNPIPPVYTAPPPLNPNNVYGQMNQPLFAPADLTGGMPPFANAFTAYPGPDATRQYLAMQQMYTQLMTQYFAQYSSNMSYGSAPSTAPPPPVQQPQDNVPQPNAAPNVVPRHPEEEDDYIDYLYAFVRISILSTLLLYYSSLTRVAAVTLMVVIVTLFIRISRRHQRQQLLRARRAAEVAAAEQQRLNESQSAENDVSEDAPTTESTTTETPVPTVNPQSVPYTILNLIATFFSSLIPSDPLPPVNVN